MQYNIISADSHVLEPRDLWVKYIDRAFKDRAPRVQRIDGADYFVCDELGSFSMMTQSTAGQKSELLRRLSKYEEMLNGGWDPDARVKDMAKDGVDAEVVYPTMGMRMYKIQDQPFLHACFSAYNDWVLDFAGVYPKKLRAIALVTLEDVEWAVGELQRVAKKNAAGVMVPGTPPPDARYESRRYEPFWASAEDLGLPISFHIIAGRQVDFDPKRNWASYGTLPHFIAESLTDLVFSGVFHRHPRLRVVSAENDIGWIGNLLERLDHFYGRYRHARNEQLPDSRMPSEVFKEHVWATFIRDMSGMLIRHRIGVDRIMWSNDYPHGDSTWPHSQEVIAGHFAGVPDAEKRKIVCENAAALYRFA